jgi:hypothetical protein
MAHQYSLGNAFAQPGKFDFMVGVNMNPEAGYGQLTYQGSYATPNFNFELPLLNTLAGEDHRRLLEIANFQPTIPEDKPNPMSIERMNGLRPYHNTNGNIPESIFGPRTNKDSIVPNGSGSNMKVGYTPLKVIDYMPAPSLRIAESMLRNGQM